MPSSCLVPVKILVNLPTNYMLKILLEYFKSDTVGSHVACSILRKIPHTKTGQRRQWLESNYVSNSRRGVGELGPSYIFWPADANAWTLLKQRQKACKFLYWHRTWIKVEVKASRFIRHKSLQIRGYAFNYKFNYGMLKKYEIAKTKTIQNSR